MGAVGAAVAETLAEHLQASLPETLAALAEGHPQASQEELSALYQQHIQGDLDIIKLETAALALLLGQDVTTATTQAITALENNSLGLLVRKALELLAKHSAKGAKKAKKTPSKPKDAKKPKEPKEPNAQEKTNEPNAQSAADAERYKQELRREMGKPHAEDPKLKEMLEKLHRTEENCIGSGSTAAAVRHEILTGELTKGKSHIQKAEQGVDWLERWLQRNPTARAGDRAAAENMLKDLKDALSTVREGVR